MKQIVVPTLTEIPDYKTRLCTPIATPFLNEKKNNKEELFLLLQTIDCQ